MLFYGTCQRRVGQDKTIKEKKKKSGENHVDIFVDKKGKKEDKWKTKEFYAHSFSFIPSTASRSRVFVDNS